MKENRNTESYPLTTDREKSNFLKATLSFDNSQNMKKYKIQNIKVRQISKCKFEIKAQERETSTPPLQYKIEFLKNAQHISFIIRSIP